MSINITPAALGDRERLAGRRTVMALLVLVTMVASTGALAWVLAADGLSGFDLALLACFLVTLPWNVINFWNALIGLGLLCLARDPLAAVVPQVRRFDPRAPIRGRTAIVMPVHNEDPERVFRHLAATLASLDSTGDADAFEVFVLSDTRRLELAAEEACRFAVWRAADPRPERLHYRRRTDNAGAKTGNLWDFLETHGHRFAYFLVLDADSVMTGPAVTRLARMMDASPRLGIVQSLTMGLPSRSAFARIFQYGMRHGMRTYTMGSAWWQGDGGPYWGHNAILRVDAFMAHCRLPLLPGRPPFGGRILSHDQVEAVMMRRAGYEVRVVPDEHGSYEESPPTLPDFLQRDLRWCQGNMQYGRLLGLRGMPMLGRIQLALAMLMYLQAPAWLLFMALGMAQAVAVATGWAAPSHLPSPARAAAAVDVGIAMFAFVMLMVFMPKLAGVAQTLAQPAVRRAYGGGRLVLGSLALELAFSTLISPILAVTHTKFIASMLFGRTVIWSAQARDVRHVPLLDALRNLWPPMLVGATFIAVAWSVAPGALPWLVPVVTGMLLAAPFAWLTSLPGLGRWIASSGLCATPEELAPPAEVRAAGYAAPLEPVRAGALVALSLPLGGAHIPPPATTRSLGPS